MCHSIRYTWPNFFPLRFMSLFFLPLLSVFLFKENVRTNEVKKTRNVYEFLNDKTNWPRNEFSLHSSTNSSVSHFHFFSERTAPRQTGKYMTRKNKRRPQDGKCSAFSINLVSQKHIQTGV